MKKIIDNKTKIVDIHYDLPLEIDVNFSSSRKVKRITSQGVTTSEIKRLISVSVENKYYDFTE